jgi:hypothetical protein
MVSLYDHVLKLMSPDVFYIATYDEATHICEFPLFYDQGSLTWMPPRDVARRGLTGAVILGNRPGAEGYGPGWHPNTSSSVRRRTHRHTWACHDRRTALSVSFRCKNMPRRLSAEKSSC